MASDSSYCMLSLGMDCNYKNYQNQYNTETLGLNKHQHAEDRDRKRYLSHKFSLTPASDFKWNGATFGTRLTTVNTLRASVVQLEGALPASLLHSNWSLHRNNWIKAVTMCNSPKDFALALAILEACIKPVLFNHVWSHGLGNY